MNSPIRSLALLCLSSVVLPSAAWAACGDGVLDAGEGCDDLNAVAGDGCDASCQVEDGYQCVDASFELDFAELLVSSDPTHSAPSWSLSSDGLTVQQALNALPAVYASTLPAVGVSMSFELTVNTTSDDDFIGWAIGYDSGENVSSSADWLLFDWKQADQNWDGHDGWAGLRMYRVTGAIDSSYEMWGHSDSVTELARALTLGSTGWADNTTYTVQVDYSTTQIDVYVDGALEFSESGSWPTGNFGFYNFSQPAIEYTLVSPVDQSVCAEADSDGDGITDLVEDALGTDRDDPDSDGDGLDDLAEVVDIDDPVDSDGDGLIDAVDDDDDDDGIPTASEDIDGDGDPSGDDSDDDGTPDYLDDDDDDDGVPTASEDWDGDGDPSTGDADGDGTPDYLDDDSDDDGSGDASDCDPADASINPGATEICDGVDNDCDGSVDEDDPSVADATTVYEDSDGDGYGDPSSSTTTCTIPSGWVDDHTDCDDSDAAVNPGATELCNGIDDDCDGMVDEDDASDAATWYADADADGYGDPSDSVAACDQPTGRVEDATDCDDDDGAVNPAATELCDGVDNDCDGTVDEDDASDASTWYSDADHDGYGDPGSSVTSCDQPPDTSSGAGDCDDGDAAVNPGAEEIWYDGVDQDCSGGSDYDQDADGYDSAEHTDDGLDCDDSDEAVNPDADEIWYDGVDQDCDGGSDFDRDGDGYDSESYGGEDCDDADADTYPGAPDEPYDGVITDCDHSSDYDADQDGHDAIGYGGDDCDDAASDVNPEQDEIWYDGVDQDCDGNDDDQDEDGWPVDEDCDDTDPDAYPNAEGWTEDCEPMTGDSGDTGVLPGDTGDDKDAGGECQGCSAAPATAAPALLMLLGLVGLRRRRG
jgi:MYXO-CTERM domain-containing protein